MRRPSPEDLGRPDLKLAGLQVWAHSGGEDWLSITAHCGEKGASVWVSGEILFTPALRTWLSGVEAIYEGNADAAELGNLEPEIDWSLTRADSRGHLSFVVEITPDHLAQQHRFEFEIDQSYLPGHVREIKEILRRRGA